MDIRGYEEDEDTSSIDLGKAIFSFKLLILFNEAFNLFDNYCYIKDFYL